MRLADLCALLIAGFLMLLVMTVLGVKLLPEQVVNGNCLASALPGQTDNGAYVQVSTLGG